jgi:arylsulfatase A-like enzyme
MRHLLSLLLRSMALAAALLLTLAPNVRAAEQAVTRPNILFVMADDLGWGDLGCYGQKHIRTPNLDRLAAEGTRFTDVYAGASVCAPSRSVLMTGQHTGHTRVRGNAAVTGGVGPQRRVPLEPQDRTVAEVLQKAGYATGITGKWGLGEPGTAGIPTRQGFDQWLGYLNQQHAHNYYPDYLWRNEERLELLANTDGKQGRYSHDLFTDFALDFVRQHQAKPFFLYLAWTIPHGKYQIPSLEPYADEKWEHDYKVHAAMVTRMDRDFGRLMGLLKELKIDDRTIVFFCSDNGAVLRRDGVLDSAGPFRGQKGTQYEGGLRTPMIVRWPAQVPAGKVSDVPWYFADVLPTLADLAGATVPENVDGLSVLPTLLGQPQELGGRRLYWEQYSGGFQQAVRAGRWKAHRKADGMMELYDLARDPAEKRNVAREFPEEVQRLAVFMKEAHTDSPYWPVKRDAKKPPPEPGR